MRKWFSRSAGWALAFGAVSASAAFAQDNIHIWVKGFIPSSHPGNPGYVFPSPADPNKFLIHEPVPSSRCAATDNRTFAKDPKASARLTTEFVLVINGQQVSVAQADSRPKVSTGASSQIACETGAVVATKTASTSNMHIGNPAFADGVAQVVIDGRASYPFIPVAPDVEYGGTFTFTAATGMLRFQGSTKTFPAYEAYAQWNNGPIVSLFQVVPGKGTTVVSLIDLGTGLQQRAVDVTVKLSKGG